MADMVAVVSIERASQSRSGYASGARVCALLEALIAPEPVVSRPMIRGWLVQIAGFRAPTARLSATSVTGKPEHTVQSETAHSDLRMLE
jgi:hypothetical protein